MELIADSDLSCASSAWSLCRLAQSTPPAEFSRGASSGGLSTVTAVVVEVKVKAGTYSAKPVAWIAAFANVVNIVHLV